MRIKTLLSIVFIIFILGCKPRLVSTNDEFGNQIFSGHNFSIEAVAFSQDGRYLASLDKGGVLIVRDLTKRTQWSKEVGGKGNSGDRRMSLAFSPIGNQLAVNTSVAYKNIFTVTIYNSHSGKQNKVIYTGQEMSALLFDETGHLLCAGSSNGVTEWSPASGNKIREFKIADGYDARFTRIALSNDGKALVAAGQYFYWVWDYNDERLMYSANNSKNTQYKESAYLVDGRRLVRDGSTNIEESEFYKGLVDRDVVPASSPTVGLMKLTQLVQPSSTGAIFEGYPVVIGERPDNVGWLVWGEGTKPRWTANSRVGIQDGMSPLPPQPIAFHMGSMSVAIGADTYEEVKNSNDILVHKVYVGKLKPLPID